MSGRLHFLLTAALLAASVGASGQQALPSHTLLGTVRDTGGKALPGTTVELANPADTNSVRTVVSDADGRYRIERVLPGLYVLTFRLAGFGSAIRDIEIGGGDQEFEFDVQLKPSVPGSVTPGPQLPRRRVVCGMTLITPPQGVDPGIIVPRTPPPQTNTAKPTIRAIQPTLCWEPSTDSPPAQPKR